MILLTEEIKKKLPKLGSTSGMDPATIPIIVKFFSVFTGWTWYIVEGEQMEDGDWELFGLVWGFETELGPVLLSELEVKRGMLPLVERDMYFNKHTLAEAYKGRI